jgi:hypothetical protein
MSGDAGDEYGEHDDYREYDEYGEYDEYAGSPGCDEGPLPAGPLADGHHMVLLVGIDIEASTVELVEYGLLEAPVHVMRVTPSYDLTVLTGVGQAVTYSATIEGGVITLLEPLS